VGRVDSVKTRLIDLEMYDGALPLTERWASKQILHCSLSSVGSHDVIKWRQLRYGLVDTDRKLV